MDMDWYSMSRAQAQGAAGNGAEAERDTATGAETSADDGLSRPFVSVSGAGVGAETNGALVIQTGSEDDNNGYLCMFISAGSSKASNQGPCWSVSLELICLSPRVTVSCNSARFSYAQVRHPTLSVLSHRLYYTATAIPL